MKNLLDASCREAVLARLDRLAPDTPALWGRMDVNQMVCHVTDPLRLALGDLPARDVSNPIRRTLLKWAVLGGMPPPKGKIATFPEIDQVAGGGTPPTSLAADVEALRRELARFVDRAASGGALAPSPAFGRLSGRAYGRLQYVHMDHHLRQFGV
jgi:hypothetical protein